MSIGKIILDGYRLVKSDWIVTTPYLIFAFLSYLISTHFTAFLNATTQTFDSYLLRTLVVNWGLEGLVVAFTLAMCVALVKRKSIDIVANGKLALSRLFGILVLTIWTAIPAAFVSYFVAPKLIDSTQSIPNHFMALSGVVIIISVFLMFADVLVVGPQLGPFKAMLESARIVLKNGVAVLKLITATIMVSISLQLLSVIVASVPIVGESLLFVCIQGLNYTLVTAMTVVVYYNAVAKTATIEVDA